MNNLLKFCKERDAEHAIFTEAVNGAANFIGKSLDAPHAKPVACAFAAFGKACLGIEGRFFLAFVFHLYEQAVTASADVGFDIAASLPIAFDTDYGIFKQVCHHCSQLILVDGEHFGHHNVQFRFNAKGFRPLHHF